MNECKSTVERAIELAKSGSCRSMNDIKRALAGEQYDSIAANLDGATIKKQLLALIRAAL